MLGCGLFDFYVQSNPAISFQLEFTYEKKIFCLACVILSSYFYRYAEHSCMFQPHNTLAWLQDSAISYPMLLKKIGSLTSYLTFLAHGVFQIDK